MLIKLNNSGKDDSDRFLQLLIKAVADEVISTSKAAH